MKFIIVVCDVDSYVCLLICASEIGMDIATLNSNLKRIIMPYSILTREHAI